MFLLARDRALIALTGADRQAYLQGLVSNDVAKASPQRALYAAFLTPQGKYLHDIFIASLADRLLIECEAARRPDLLRRLSLYKLRSQVALSEENSLAVALYFGGDGLDSLGLPATSGQARPEAGGIVFVDPRLAALGARAYLDPSALPAETGTGAGNIIKESQDGATPTAGTFVGGVLTKATATTGDVRGMVTPNVTPFEKW